MRYEPTPKAGVAPAREIAKVRRHTLFGGSAVLDQCLDEGCKCMHTPALRCQISCHIFVPPLVSAGA